MKFQEDIYLTYFIYLKNKYFFSRERINLSPKLTDAMDRVEAFIHYSSCGYMHEMIG